MRWSSQSPSSTFTFSLPHKNLRGYIPNLTGARYFSKLDARSGYWAIKLTEKSSHLTSFNTPFGRYRFAHALRLQICPIRMSALNRRDLRRIAGCHNTYRWYFSWWQNALWARRKFTECLDTRKKGVKLNSDKLAVGLTDVPYFGHIPSADGHKPDPGKITAIRDMEHPRLRKELWTIN